MIIYTINKIYKAKNKGYETTLGVIKAVFEVITMLIVIFGIITVILNTFSLKVDDTDFSGWKRSGLSLHTDAKTGLQYLSHRNGALIPRLDENGEHIIKEAAK